MGALGDGFVGLGLVTGAFGAGLDTTGKRPTLGLFTGARGPG